MSYSHRPINRENELIIETASGEAEPPKFSFPSLPNKLANAIAMRFTHQVHIERTKSALGCMEDES